VRCPAVCPGPQISHESSWDLQGPGWGQPFLRCWAFPGQVRSWLPERRMLCSWGAGEVRWGRVGSQSSLEGKVTSGPLGQSLINFHLSWEEDFHLLLKEKRSQQPRHLLVHVPSKAGVQPCSWSLFPWVGSPCIYAQGPFHCPLRDTGGSQGLSAKTSE
jgi:hypothetical protein